MKTTNAYHDQIELDLIEYIMKLWEQSQKLNIKTKESIGPLEKAINYLEDYNKNKESK
jgi:hypothetical protein